MTYAHGATIEIGYLTVILVFSENVWLLRIWVDTTDEHTQSTQPVFLKLEAISKGYKLNAEHS